MRNNLWCTIKLWFFPYCVVVILDFSLFLHIKLSLFQLFNRNKCWYFIFHILVRCFFYLLLLIKLSLFLRAIKKKDFKNGTFCYSVQCQTMRVKVGGIALAQKKTITKPLITGSFNPGLPYGPIHPVPTIL